MRTNDPQTETGPAVALINRQRRYRLPLKKLRPQLDRLTRLRPLALPGVCVVFVGPRTMAAANGRFLGHGGATDVMTFEHGEILVCPAVAHAEARARRIAFGDELLRYVVHGWLHLCGYDDASAPARKKMYPVQERLVRRLGSAR